MSGPVVESSDVAPDVYDDVSSLDERGFLRKARALASRLPFVRHLVAMWHALRDDATPWPARMVIVGAIAYFVLPADAVADFLPLIGFGDDAAVIAAALRTIARHVHPRHYAQADETLRRARGEVGS